MRSGRERFRTQRAGAAVVIAIAGMLTATFAPVEAAGSVPLSTGSNAFGQLGSPGVTSRSTPGPVSVPGTVAIASGRDTAYALDETGAVWAWGLNDKGQVGDGTTTNRPAPVKLNLTGVVAIEAGHYHALAVRSDGTVWTWGYGSLGQLGLGTTNSRSTPTQVPGLTGIKQVAGGRDMSYALRSDGTVLAWGSNAMGEVGDGTTVRRNSPVVIPNLSGVVEISGGRNHGVARLTDGTVKAWGDNQYGQLGDGTTTRRSSPVTVSNLTGVAHVDAGAHHTVAVRTDGAVLTWGRGYRGQLGLGSTANRLSPTVVPGVPASVEVGDGRDQTFAITADGDVYAWGQNTNGQLGDGTTTVRTTPVKLAISGIVAAQSGSAHTVFLPGESTPPPPTNVAPVASFASSCSGLVCSFDSSASTDSDGTIVERRWTFGPPGAAETGATAQFTYPGSGTYTVTLTVTDDDGATGTASSTVTVNSEPPVPSSIAFRAVATASSNTTALSVTVPATVQENDQLLAFVSTNVAVNPLPPAGWTLVADKVISSGDLQTRVFAHRGTAGDAGSTVRFALSAMTKVDVTLLAYSGVQAASPIAAVAMGEEIATTTVHVAPSLASVPASAWVVSYWAEKSSTSSDWVGPGDMTQRGESVGTGSGRILSLTADSGAAVTAGAWTGRSATSATAGRKVTTVSLALRPA